MLDNLALILVRTRFPENIGMCARAAANMGCGQIILVSPERWDKSRAEPLATPKGMAVLDGIEVRDDLADALAPFGYAMATTARLGGWRRGILHPEQAALTVRDVRNAGQKTAIVLGSEDRGLSNEEISQCDAIVHIPTAGASSINLAQAALIMLYECHKLEARERVQDSRTPRTISREEETRLEDRLKQALLSLQCLPSQNADYHFLQWQRLLRRSRLRRHEYDAFMGLCRQILNGIKL